MRFSMTAYPWDFDGEEASSRLDRLQGDVGLNGVSLWAAAAPSLQFRMEDGEWSMHRSDGGLFFQPSSYHYEGTRCRPLSSGFRSSKAAFMDICQACVERVMLPRAIVSACGTGGGPRRYPEFACRNVFGLESRNTVCLANPDVAGWLAGEVSDLTWNHPLAGVMLTDYEIGWREAWHERLPAPWALSQGQRKLLSTCFCNACRKGASADGVDVEDAKSQLCAAIGFQVSNHLSTRVDEAQSGDVSSALFAYRQWQSQRLNALLGRIRDASRAEIWLVRKPSVDTDDNVRASDVSPIAGLVTDVPVTGAWSNALDRRIRNHELWIGPDWAARDESDLVQMLAEASSVGIHGVEFDHLGLYSESGLSSLRRAARFARRNIAVS